MSDTSLTLNKTGAIGIGGETLFPGTSPKPTNPFGSSSLNLGGMPYFGQGNQQISNSGLPSSPSVLPTQSGGFSFNPQSAPFFSTPAKTSTPSIPSAPRGSLSDYLSNTTTSPNGGKLTTSGDGTPSNFNPNNGFQIGTQGSVPSSALTNNTSPNDLTQSHNQYMDYVQALAKAQGYSPEYVNALQQQQQAQLQSAGLNYNQAQYGANSSNINALSATGAGVFSGLGQGQSQAVTGQQQALNTQGQAQNTLQQAQNSIQQLSANQQMQVQALIRSGNISAAQSLVQASQPVGVSPGTSLVSPLGGQQIYSGLGGLTGVNALNQANSLQASHPDANIPSYDPNTMTPQEYQQMAMKAVAASPSFQSSTPEGQANISSLVSQQAYLDTTTRSYQTATSNLGTLQTFMQQNNLNQASVPIINQIANKFKGQTNEAGVVDAFKSSIAGLRAEYAQVLSRGGQVTDSERNAANTLIPDDLNPSQLATVTKQLSLEGQNAINEAQAQVNKIKNRLGGNTGTTGGTSTGWY